MKHRAPPPARLDPAFRAAAPVAATALTQRLTVPCSPSAAPAGGPAGSPSLRLSQSPRPLRRSAPPRR